MNSQQATPCLDEILITDRLYERPAKAPRFQEEIAAFHAIARELNRSPEGTLDTLVNTALSLCGAGSAGVSLLERDGNGEGHFRWVAMAGAYAPYKGGTTPRGFSPCGATLDRNAPQLFDRPARLFTYFRKAEPPAIIEGLVVPFRSGEIEGTIWVVTHEEEPLFTREDARILASLGDFTAAALAAQAARQRLERVEREVTDSEALLKRVFDSVKDHAIFTIDLAGNVTSWNAGAEQVFGYAEAEILGRCGDVLWTPQDRAAGVPERERRAAVATGCATDERWLQRCDGSKFFASGALTPLFGDDGSLSGFTKVCRDITDRRNAEDRAAAILESVTDAFFAVDREWRFTYLNGEAERVLLHRREQLLGRSIWAEFPAAIGTEFERQYRKAMDEGIPAQFTEYYPQPLDRWYEVRVYPSAEGLSVYFQDISERRRNEEALRESEARKAAMLETALDCIISIDRDGKIIEFNKAAEQTFGYRREEAMGHEMAELIIPPELRGRHRDGLERVLTTENSRIQGRRIELEATRADGRRFPVELAIARVPMEGKPVFMAYLRDITERKLVEETLRESERRFRQLADAVPQIVWVTRPDGYHEYFNRRWYEFTGVPGGSTDGDGWERIIHPDDRGRANERWRHSLATGEPYEIEYRLRHHSGEYRWALGRALPIRNGQGEIKRWFGTCTDIDDIRRLTLEREHLLESERAARSEAERASRLKDEFLATVSHELRTPLNAMLGWAQVLTRGKVSDETVQQGLAVIERNARAQAQLIEDLLDMSRVITGRIRLDARPVDPREVVIGALEAVGPAAEAKGIRIESVLNSNGGTVHGDAERLQQVVSNLLSNAVKFTPKGGGVRVALDRVEDQVEIRVVDTGEGIAPQFLPFVFERFRQADGSTKRQHGGLGLGLAIAKQLVDLHGGRIWAESAGKGQGATFVVQLPVAAEPPPEEVRYLGSANGAREIAYDALCASLKVAHLTVLAIDDEPDALVLIRRVLEDCDARVLTAASASEGLELLRQERPDVLLSDIGMPGMDGYELIRRIRTLAPEEGGKVPAAALTAFVRPEDRERALAAGYNAHVAKPVRPADLIATVSQFMRRP